MAAPIRKLRDGDRIRIDAEAGTIDVDVVEPRSGRRARAQHGDLRANRFGFGRELFAMMRAQVGTAEAGGSALFVDEDRSAR